MKNRPPHEDPFGGGTGGGPPHRRETRTGPFVCLPRYYDVPETTAELGLIEGLPIANPLPLIGCSGYIVCAPGRAGNDAVRSQVFTPVSALKWGTMRRDAVSADPKTGELAHGDAP